MSGGAAALGYTRRAAAAQEGYLAPLGLDLVKQADPEATRTAAACCSRGRAWLCLFKLRGSHYHTMATLDFAVVLFRVVEVGARLGVAALLLPGFGQHGDGGPGLGRACQRTVKVCRHAPADLPAARCEGDCFPGTPRAARCDVVRHCERAAALLHFLSWHRVGGGHVHDGDLDE